ncbi:MAG: SusC/RagA family TonB-linked outer membrane protein [Candidatus Kapaibacterium sp.]
MAVHRTAVVVHAQDSRKVSGTIIDSDTKQGLVGAVVKVKGTKTGVVVRNSNGSFSIDVPKGYQTLVVSLVGKKTTEVNIAGKDNVTVTMRTDALQMDKVVVTAVGLEKETKALGYSTEQVSGATITAGRPTDVINSLQGQVAGAQINSSSGSPGAAAYIRLRGVNSLQGNNQPVFVVDGILIDNSYMGTSNEVGGVDLSSRAVDINPDDIETVNVLKGAAATALYGLNASAGAIVITTKKGRRDGSTNVNYSYTMGMEEVNKLPELQNKYSQGNGGVFQGEATRRAHSWGALIDTLRYDGATTNQWNKNGNIVGQSNALAKSAVAPFDNLNSFFQTGGSQQHSLNISSGSSTGAYFFSITDFRQTGIVPNSTFDRTSLRLNSDYSLYPNVKISANAQYVRSGGQKIQKGSNVSGVMLGLLRTPPTFDNANGVSDPVNDATAYMFANGLPRGYRGLAPSGTSIYDNPFWTVNKNMFTERTERFIGGVQVDYFPETWFGEDLLGEFSATYRIGGDFYNTRNRGEYAIYSANTPTGRVTDDDLRSQQINSELLFNFNKKLSDDLDLGLVLGSQVFENFGRSFTSQGDGLVIPGFYNQSNATSQVVFETQSLRRRLGMFAQASIAYQDMLFVNGSLRNEYSTSLPKDNDNFLNYNLSLSFVLSQALELDRDGALSFAKLRFSNSQIGSDAPIYSLTTPYVRTVHGDGWVNSNLTYPLNGVAGFAQSSGLGNNGIVPETRVETEFGTELRFFGDAVGLDLTYYSTVNSNQIFSAPVATATGYSSRLVNAGEMKNSGIEAVLKAQLLKTDDLTINGRLTYTSFTQEVVKLSDGVENIFLGGFTGGSVRAVAGLPYGSIFGQKWLRNDKGQIITDGGVPQVTDEEYSFGSNIPDFIINGGLDFSYKGLSVSLVLDWKEGGKMWNGTRAALNNFGTSKESENRGNMNGTFGGITFKDGVVQNAVELDGSANTTPINGQQFWGNLGTYNNFSTSLIEPFIEDAGWMRLRQVSISYIIPQSMISGLGVFKSLEVFATGRNLWLSTDYTGVDPETNLIGSANAQGLDYFNMPGTKGYNFGIRAGF